jgi:hypothetical protein
MFVLGTLILLGAWYDQKHHTVAHESTGYESMQYGADPNSYTRQRDQGWTVVGTSHLPSAYVKFAVRGRSSMRKVVSNKFPYIDLVHFHDFVKAKSTGSDCRFVVTFGNPTAFYY